MNGKNNRNKNRGRLPTSVEFFRKLYVLSGFKTQAEFAHACGRAQQDVASYLSGFKVPGEKVLRSTIRHLYEWDVQPLLEVVPVPKKPKEIPMSPGVYVIFDSAARVLYVGKATSFRAELRQTLGRSIPVAVRIGPSLAKRKPLLREMASYISLYEVRSPRGRHNLEALLLRIFANQTHNSSVGHFQA
jgi:hypothetical protein